MDSIALRMNIIRARRNNPCATLRELGDRFSITRERVRQVLSQAGKPTSAYHQTYLCIQCGKDVGIVKKLFCSKQCRSDYAHTQISCSYCGKLKEYSVKHIIWAIEYGRHSPDLFFCSKQCQGAWLAREHGFPAHPENRALAQHERKWDYSKVYELRDRTGWGLTRIGRALGIPESTIGKILRKRVLTLQ